MSLKINAKGNSAADVWIYGDIGDDFFSDESFSAKDLADLTAKLENKTLLTVHINSAGGSVTDGVAIYNLLKNHKAKVITEIDGMALSIASVIALAGDTVKMAGNAFYMIHNPWSYAVGNAEELRAAADRLDVVRNVLVGTYNEKTGDKLTMEEIISMMDAETWFTANQALENGFIDEITNPIQDVAKCDLTKYNFKNIPRIALQKAVPRLDSLRLRLANMNMKVARTRLTATNAEAIN